MQPVTHPSQAQHPAYRITHYDHTGAYGTELRSLATVRVLIEAAINAPYAPGGTAVIHPVSGQLVIATVWMRGQADLATPADDFPVLPQCAHCGHWEFEHQIPNPSACHLFSVEPIAAEAARWFCPRCGRPVTEHPLPYTRACGLDTAPADRAPR